MAKINAQPYDFKFETFSIALIVIDMQRDFIEAGGFGESLGNDVTRLQAIVPTVKKLIEGFRAVGLPVIHTRECHLADLSDCPDYKRNRGEPHLRIGDDGPMGRLLIKGEAGVEIIPNLRPTENEHVIDKPGKGAFYATNLQKILTDMKIQQLVFAGVTTEVCVQTTMREANDRGYSCLLATDATESYFAEFKLATIDMMIAQSGIVGCASTTEDILSALHD